MHLQSEIIVIISSLLSFCQTQTYGAQRRYSQPATQTSTFYYIPPTTYHQSSENGKSSYYNSLSNNKQKAQRNSKIYASSIESYSPYKQITAKNGTPHPYSQSTLNSLNRNYDSIPLKENDRSLLSSSALSNPSFKGSYGSSIDSLSNKQYLSNSYNSDNYKKVSSRSTSSAKINGKYHISKADAENAKFAGARNQENDEQSRTLHLKRKKFHRRFGGVFGNPCSPFGRIAGSGGTRSLKEQGRFLWDVNVYNVYPQSSINCGGYSGFGNGLGGALGAGLLSDPIGPAYYPPGAGIASFLSLFAPGILQNSLAATARPQQFADYGQLSNGGNDLQSDPEVDSNYSPGPAAVPIRRPNPVFYDSSGAPAVTPSQLVGGISTTVNGIIQQLTGNVQPVYG